MPFLQWKLSLSHALHHSTVNKGNHGMTTYMLYFLAILSHAKGYNYRILDFSSPCKTYIKHSIKNTVTTNKSHRHEKQTWQCCQNGESIRP